jgi:hypothetical protein
MANPQAEKARLTVSLFIIFGLVPAVTSISTRGQFASLTDWWNQGAQLSSGCPSNFYGDDFVSRAVQRYSAFMAGLLVPIWNAVAGVPLLRWLLAVAIIGVIGGAAFELVKALARFFREGRTE